MANEEYIGICKGCNQCKVLKAGACEECAKTANKQFEDFYKDIIREKPDGL